MRILNLEDNIFKQHDICKAIEKGLAGTIEIDCTGNLADGLARICEQEEKGVPYDLIITDMWYPEKPGEVESQSGEKLIQTMKEKGWNIPVILCSSVRYRFPGILGSVHYSEKENWEMELINLIKNV